MSGTKSSQPLRITITEPLAALIAKYDNDSPYIFPILRDNAPFSHYDQYRSALARINRNLKRVGLKLGLTTPLTTYVARHTWATLAKQCGAPVAVISEGLGHASGENHAYLPERIRQRRTGSNKRNCDPFIANFQGPEKFFPDRFYQKKQPGIAYFPTKTVIFTIVKLRPLFPIEKHIR